MVKNVLLVLVLAAVAAGGVFAQTDFETMPKNTIVVDVGPTIIGAAFGAVGSAVGEEGLSSSGFGIGVQYERQILTQLSVAGRFAYLGAGVGIGDSFDDAGATVKTSLGVNLAAISLEAHARYYPLGEIFFLGGMLGFGNLSVGFSGEVAVKDENTNQSKKESVSFTASRGYFKLGARLGWRIDFGNQGGFTFEPSFGYDLALGVGNTLGKELESKIKGDVDLSAMDEAFKILEDFIFVGGPRLTLAFGWRF